MRLLNVGGGSKQTPIPAKYEGWQHDLLDIQEGPDVDHVSDARLLADRPQIRNYDVVYCAHNLEHYFDHDVPRVLAGMKAALKPGGEVHIIVPNLGQLICDMIDLQLDLEDVLYQSAAGPITPLDVFFGYRKEIEESGQDFYAHKTGFTARRLHKVLERAGFEDVKVVANLPCLELEATGRVSGDISAPDSE
jgi:SAM-dependent methyltransferase